MNARVLVTDVGFIIEFDSGETTGQFAYSLPLHWPGDNALAGSVDVSDDGSVLGLELVGVETEIRLHEEGELR